MKVIIDIEQNTPEWLEWRKNGIGGSEIAILMGNSIYKKTPYILWQEKCGYAQEKDNSSMQAAFEHGHNSELKVIEWLEENMKLNVKPLCIEDRDLPFMKASLDGYCEKKKMVVEIKSPFTINSLNKIREHNEYPTAWYDQIQWNMGICQAEMGLLAIWEYDLQRPILIEIARDELYFCEMLKQASRFWEKVEKGEAPPLTEKDYVEIEDENLLNLLEAYKSFSSDKKDLENQIKDIKEKILEYGDDGNFRAYGYTIQRVQPRKTYDIEKMRSEGINVEAYLKPEGIGFYRIRVPPS